MDRDGYRPRDRGSGRDEWSITLDNPPDAGTTTLISPRKSFSRSANKHAAYYTARTGWRTHPFGPSYHAARNTSHSA